MFTGLRAALTPPIIMVLSVTSLYGGIFDRGFSDTRSAAMGFAVTGISLNAATSFYNPAGMCFLEKSQLAGGLSMSSFKGSYLSPYTGNTDLDNKVIFPIHLYAAIKTGERTAAGVSLNTPYNQNIKWPSDWTGRYIVRETETKATYLQSSFAYKFNDTFSGSIGALFAFGKHLLVRDVPIAGNAGDIGMELDAGMIGFGFNVALFYKPTDEFSMGLDYRSSVKLKEKDGEATFSNVPSSLTGEIPSSTSFGTEFTLPASIRVGAAYELTRELILSADLGYTFFSVYDNIEYDFEDAEQDFSWNKNYQDTYNASIGAKFKTGDLLDVMGGVGFVSSAVQDDYASPADMHNETFHFSLGTTFHIGTSASIDIAYQLLNIRERESFNEELQFGGNYKTQKNNFGLTFNYQF
jgi:long-chain fatty acid transport protein